MVRLSVRDGDVAGDARCGVPDDGGEDAACDQRGAQGLRLLRGDRHEQAAARLGVAQDTPASEVVDGGERDNRRGTTRPVSEGRCEFDDLGGAPGDDTVGGEREDAVEDRQRAEVELALAAAAL